MKRKPQCIGPVHRALAYRQWTDEGVEAQIHAITGADPKELANLAGRMFFTVLGAAMAAGMTGDEPDLRIVRGAVNAVYDQVDQPVITPAARAAINSGLEAVKRLAQQFTQRQIVDAHFDMLTKLRVGDVLMSDFQNRIERLAA